MTKITNAERQAAAIARVTADKKRGVQTPRWIVELAFGVREDDQSDFGR